jgi:molybdenum cofactor biosynthesis enzyme MoaA
MSDQTMTPVNVASDSAIFPPRRFLCQRPWEQLLIGPNDAYGPCCDLLYHGKRPKSREDVMALYNSPEMQSVRHALLTGVALETTCKGCSVAGAGGYIPAGHESFYRGKKPTIDEPPAEIVAGVSPVCNLRCVMCDAHSGPLVKDLGKDDLRLIEEIGFDHVSVVTITGGEPFLTPDSIDLLRGLAARDTGNMKIRVITNAQVIGVHFDLIERLRNLHLTISIDGVGEVYERVRPRAKWDRLVTNLERLKALRDHRRDMILSINTVVMRSTLPCLPEMVELAAWLDARVDFQIIREGSCADEEILGAMPRDEVVTALDSVIDAVRQRSDLGRHQHDMERNLGGLCAHVDWWWSQRSGLPQRPQRNAAASIRRSPCAATSGENLVPFAELKDYANWWINDIIVAPVPAAPHLAPVSRYRVAAIRFPIVAAPAGAYVLLVKLLARKERRAASAIFACDIHTAEGILLQPAVDFRAADGTEADGGFREYRLPFVVDHLTAGLDIRLWNYDNAELLVRSVTC